MDFYSIVIIVALLILIILLTLFGIFYKNLTYTPFPSTQDPCPKLWSIDNSGLCVNPLSTDVSTNFLPVGGTWQTDTPGYVSSANGSFDTNHNGWASYSGAKSDVCGKQKWAKNYNIQWNGVTSYNGC
jgi:hypothetical protein